MDSQSNAIHQYCRQNGIEKYKIFKDEGISGAKASRPALDDMLEQIKDGKAKHLIVFSFSRFSRSCSHLLKSLEFLEEHKCRFTSVSEQIETSTIMGKTLLAVLGALGEMERSLIVERVKAGLERAKAEGKHIGRKKTRPSEMIRKVLIRGVTYREAAHICNTSQGSISLEAKEMRKEFRADQLPKYLTIDDIRGSSFFEKESKKSFDKVAENLINNQLPPDLPPLPVLKEPVAEMQPTYGQAAYVERKTIFIIQKTGLLARFVC